MVVSSVCKPRFLPGESGAGVVLKNRNTVSFAILFVISKIWKPPKCPSIDEWMKACVYIYNGILLSHKRNEILSFVTT